ncbi:MAG: PAS domain-containing protein [Acetobacteraceae bacterium]|nr:PAS domain-containing protein [Acetobacteraceae bacterium]
MAARARPNPTGRESPLGDEELIVTKTDPQGRIAYANDVFLRVSDLHLAEALGQPHSLIRHPDMPRSVFKLMWDTIGAGGEFFGYVVNLATNGDHYWVFAHVTPSRDAAGRVTGFHSSRRKPDPAQVARIEPIYRRLIEEERRHDDRRAGLQAGTRMFEAMLAERKVSYDAFAFSL